ncbi:MAG: hypothetical protein WCL18_03740 [bacterium]
MIITHAYTAKEIHKYFNTNISEKEFFAFNLTNAEIMKYEIQ